MNFNFISDYWNTHNTDEDIISKAGEVCDSKLFMCCFIINKWF